MAEPDRGGPPRLPDAALFDLDDTIMATSEGAREAWVAVTDRFAPELAELGHPASPDAIMAAMQDYRLWYWSDAARNHVGRLAPGEALRQNLRGGLERLNITARPALIEEMSTVWSEVRWDAVRPLPGALETLRLLRTRGVRLGLITNGSADLQDRKVRRLGLGGLMDHIQIEGAFGVGKPDPRAYENALSALGVAASGAWMAGDNLELDVLAPMRMGIRGIWVDGDGDGLPAGSPGRPDLIVRAIADLV